MKSFRFLLFAFFGSTITLSHFSCSDPEPKQIVNKPKEETCEISNKPKLFLDFWGQMSENDFNCIKQTLVKSHKLSVNRSQNMVYYIIDNDSLEVGAEYEYNKLLKVTLGYRSNPFDQDKKIYIDGITYSENTVDSSFYNRIETSLFSKYGKPIKESNARATYITNASDQESDFYLTVRHYISEEWIKDNKLIVFKKIVTPAYTTMNNIDNNGQSVLKYKIVKYQITGLAIEYINKELDDLITKKDIKYRQEDSDKINKKLEKL